MRSKLSFLARHTSGGFVIGRSRPMLKRHSSYGEMWWWIFVLIWGCFASMGPGVLWPPQGAQTQVDLYAMTPSIPQINQEILTDHKVTVLQ